MKTITAEPQGAIYEDLIRFALSMSARFSLVWQRGFNFGAEAAAIESALRPSLLEERESSSWPGTELIGATALVRFYRAAPDVLAELAAAGRLYAWLAPARPEDLAFYSPNGEFWLGSTSHEQDSFVDPTAVDVVALRSAVPGLLLSTG